MSSWCSYEIHTWSADRCGKLVGIRTPEEPEATDQLPTVTSCQTSSASANALRLS